VNRYLPSASLETLQARAELLVRLRHFFHARNFWEVETPWLGSQSIVDRFLDPIAADFPFSNDRRTGWLQTSPELNMKRLLVAGAKRIFQVGHAFRHDERGSLHNPEFTIVEWYRIGDNQDTAIELLIDLCGELLTSEPAVRVRYAEAFQQSLDINPHTADVQQLRDITSRFRCRPPDELGEDRDEWLNFLFAEFIQPNLGQDRPVVLYDYPATQAALAQIRDDDPPVAERFELFLQGIELANGYHELQNPEELRQRQVLANQQRAQVGKPPLPLPELLIEAMSHGLPSCAGVALGFDRLVMLALGAKSIDEVLAFPIDRA
jgi:lysyl-tRNA synthetase class 2